jgi:hypothetical protein
MYSVHITDIAEEEILIAVKYIADVLRVTMSANNLLDEIEKYENILETTPNIFSFVPDEYLRAKEVNHHHQRWWLTSRIFLMRFFNHPNLRLNILLIFS